MLFFAHSLVLTLRTFCARIFFHWTVVSRIRIMLGLLRLSIAHEIKRWNPIFSFVFILISFFLCGCWQHTVLYIITSNSKTCTSKKQSNERYSAHFFIDTKVSHEQKSTAFEMSILLSLHLYSVDSTFLAFSNYKKVNHDNECISRILVVAVM